jgi:hypothetical protein
VGIGIHQADVLSAAREFHGEFDRERRAAGRAGRAPHRDDPWPHRIAGVGFRRSVRRTDGRRTQPLGELPGADPQRERRLQTEHRGDPLVAGPVGERNDADGASVARGHDGCAHRRARRLQHDGVGLRERGRDVLRSSDAPVAVIDRVVGYRDDERGCRHHRDHDETLGLEALRQIAAVRLVDRDDHPHCDAPEAGTTDSADWSAIAASVAATSDLGITISRAAEPPPIIESSRVTDTTVASATRMRGAS